MSSLLVVGVVADVILPLSLNIDRTVERKKVLIGLKDKKELGKKRVLEERAPLHTSANNTNTSILITIFWC
jgi:hypothetical protein